jgi:hypothetical protein
MYVCKNCGEQYRGNYGTCGKCGGTISIVPDGGTNSLPPKPPPNTTSFWEKRSWREKVAIISILFIMVFAIGSSFIPQQSYVGSSTTAYADNQPFLKRSGEIAVLKDNSLISINEAAEDELTRYAVAKNTEAMARMIYNGRVVTANAGTRVTIVKKGWESSYIEVMDGPSAGARGWLINSMMR